MTPEMVAKGPLRDAQQGFFNALKEAGISTAEVSHSLGYDPSLTVINVLRKLPPNPTAVQVRDALEATHGISGVNSIIDYRDGSQRGVGINAVVIVRWDAAKEGFDAVSKPGGSPLKK
jgi:hypothetical protein